MATTPKDIVFALRMLARNPGFTFVAVATLGLGIGANTAIFSVVEGVLLKPLPFRDPDRLSMVWQKSKSGTQLGISELDLDDYRARTRVFEGLGGYTVPGTKSAILTGAGNPVEIAPCYVTQNYFLVLGVSPLIGRDFLPAETLRGRNKVVILGYSFWQSRFGGSRDILSQQITLNKQKLQVLGVMGPEVYPAGADVFIPFTQVNPEQPKPRNYHELNVVGRLRPGQTLADARKEMDALSTDLERAYPVTNSGIGAFVTTLSEEVTGNVRRPIIMLLSAVGLVLLIASGNVANLILVRAAARQKEIAIRIALGAGRATIIRQFIIECLLLSTCGAVFGLLFAVVTMPLIRNLGAERIPRMQHIGVDSRVLLFTAAIAVITGLIFGLIPALRYPTGNLNRALRAGGRSSRSESGMLRNVLVAAEVALALVVLVAASLLIRSLNQLLDVQPGFRADHLLVARLALPTNRYKNADVHKFYARLLPRIGAISGVASVSATSALPLSTAVPQTRFIIQGAPPPDPGNYPVTGIVSVDSEYFKTMGIPILQGRTFNREEVGDVAEERCIVNATLAHNFFGQDNPIGRTILSNLAITPPEPCRIVGVAGDTHMASLDKAPAPILYFASYVAKGMLVVRTTTDPLTVAGAIQREVAAADPEQPLSHIGSMDQVLLQSISRPSFAAVLLVMFAALGLILAALGLYGVLSYSVAQRTQEIGVRMALGAEPASVLRMILAEGLCVSGVGLLSGIVASAGATRLMSSLLFGVGAADPLSYVVGCVLLLVVSTMACLIPAYRATRIDPIAAVRYE